MIRRSRIANCCSLDICRFCDLFLGLPEGFLSLSATFARRTYQAEHVGERPKRFFMHRLVGGYDRPKPYYWPHLEDQVPAGSIARTQCQ
jgi:hypothetical protein